MYLDIENLFLNGLVTGARVYATRSLFICLALSLCCVMASATEPVNRTIFQLQHTAWTAREGAPGPIFAISQTIDGYLWLGTSVGLYRFDGIRFEHYKPPVGKDLSSNDVSALYGAPNGGLWIGYRFGGADFLMNDRVTNYPESAGFPSGSVRRFVADQQGILWAAAYGEIGRFDGSRWKQVHHEWNYKWDSARDLFVDPKGTLWVANAETIVFLPKGEKHFQQITNSVDHPVRLAQAPDGLGWVLQEPGADHISLLHPIGPSREGNGRPVRRLGGLYSSSFLFDHAGNLWVTSIDGLLHVRSSQLSSSDDGPPDNSDTERFTRANGLTSDTQVSSFEDREGNVWIGTYSGLDRFRETNIVQALPQFNTDTTFLLLGEQGDLWLGVRRGRETNLVHLHDGAMDIEQNVLPGFGAMSRDAQGVTWAAGTNGIWRLNNGKFVPVPTSDEAPKKRDIQAIVHDHSGNLWVSYVGAGVFLRSHGIWTHGGKLAALLHATAVSMLADSAGRMWFGYLANKLSFYDGDAVRNFTTADGMPVKSVQAIHEHGKHIWVAGERGLALFKEKEKRFQEFIAAGLEFRGISGVVETARGDLWMNTTSGILRLPASEIKLAIANPAHRIVCQVFGSADGLEGKARQVRPLPTVLETPDGLLWFLTTGGLVQVDPEHLIRNTVPPTVLVRFIESNGQTYSSPEAKLPVGTRNVHIEYTATSLSAPERVRFRYKLEGMDEGWQDADTRREAFYTNLRPGDYRFRVIACNNDGVWNEAGASWAFNIAPAFYQTNWFWLLIVSAGAGLLWILYQRRLQTIAAQIDLRYAERLAERTRIARELHDTLLQGFQGLILHFHSAMKHLNDPGRTRQVMEEALKEADHVLLEGRERVRDLRSEGSAASWLQQELAAFGEELAKSSSVAFKLTVVGSSQALHPAIGDEVYRIAREALANAFHHSQASSIEVEIVYTSAMLSMRVRDDGCGIKQEILDEGRQGHWGLSGMRERAQDIRGQLRIWSNPGAGTEIELSVPAKIVYALKGRRPKEVIE